MPLYEYQCQACGKKTELLQKMNDAPLALCPECGGAVKKLFSSPAVQFKGTGWYVTDYKKGGSSSGGGSPKSGDGGKSEGGGKSESGGKSEGGGESKAEKSSSSDSASSSGGSTETKAAKASGE